MYHITRSVRLSVHPSISSACLSVPCGLQTEKTQNNADNKMVRTFPKPKETGSDENHGVKNLTLLKANYITGVR